MFSEGIWENIFSFMVTGSGVTAFAKGLVLVVFCLVKRVSHDLSISFKVKEVFFDKGIGKGLAL